MRIERLRILNYKCFKETDWIPLAPSFNVVIGPNNSGKSAFLEAASLWFAGDSNRAKPHLSATIARGRPPRSDSEVDVRFVLVKNELYHHLLQSGQFYLNFRTSEDRNCWALDSQLGTLFETSPLAFEANLSTHNLIPISVPAVSGLVESVAADVRPGLFHPKSDRSGFRFDGVGRGGPDLCSSAISVARQNTFFFSAERLNVAKYPSGAEKKLRPDAANCSHKY